VGEGSSSTDWQHRATREAREWARANGHTDLIWDDSDRRGGGPRARRSSADAAQLPARDPDEPVTMTRQRRRRRTGPRFKPSMLTEEARERWREDRHFERQLACALLAGQTVRGDTVSRGGKDGGWARKVGVHKADTILARQRALRELFDFVRSTSAFSSYGISMPRSICSIGPPLSARQICRWTHRPSYSR
jgi:hypothetical protein